MPMAYGYYHRIASFDMAYLTIVYKKSITLDKCPHLGTMKVFLI